MEIKVHILQTCRQELKRRKNMLIIQVCELITPRYPKE